MTQMQETTSELLFQEKGQYCRRVLRDKYFSSIKPKRILEETNVSIGSQDAYCLAMAEEQVYTALCANIISTREEHGLMASVSWREIGPILLRLRSSKEYSLARTSPIIDKLSQVWVRSASGFGRIIDVNRIHRNLTFDITSSDPVDDFLRIEFPMENLKIPSKFLPQLSPEILQFCSRQRILGYLPTAINLVERSFPSISELIMHPEKDPETGGEWLALNVTIQGEVDEVLNNYDNYTGHWVSSVPWPERHKIRLSYNII
jgi:hypothetical protein